MVRVWSRWRLMAGLALVAFAVGGCGGDEGSVMDGIEVPPLPTSEERLLAGVGAVCGVPADDLTPREDLSEMTSDMVMVTYETSHGGRVVVAHAYQADERQVPRPLHIDCGDGRAQSFSRTELDDIANDALWPLDADHPELPATPAPDAPDTPDVPAEPEEVTCPAAPDERVSGEQAATCLYRAWQQRDRELAEVYASVDAVETMWSMEWDGVTEWSFVGCSEVEGFAPSCSWAAGADGGGHGAEIEMVLGGSPSAGNVIDQVYVYG